LKGEFPFKFRLTSKQGISMVDGNERKRGIMTRVTHIILKLCKFKIRKTREGGADQKPWKGRETQKLIG